MISAFANCFKIPELRKRILFTLALLAICRIGAAIPLPGVIPMAVKEALSAASKSSEGGGFLGLYNTFTGGALENCSTFSLGIMPYISASIILQLMTAVVPSLQRMIREHEQGRAKFIQYTRYLTVALCLVQGYLMALGFENPASLFPGIGNVQIVSDPGWAFRILAVITMTTSTLILMWLGEQITALGIGNGISLIITIGIVARLPNAVFLTWQLFFNPQATPGGHKLNIIEVLLLLAMLIIVIGGIIAVTQAQRKIPVQYAKRMVGRKMTTGGTTFMPLRVNYSGVMPIIFAQAILMFPSKIFELLSARFNVGALKWLAVVFRESTLVYIFLYALLIFFFAYFWVSTQFQPIQIADDLKKHGGYLPGIRPGKQTADFLEKTMTRITFGGAAFLTIIAVVPILLNRWLDMPYQTAQFFGGTSMLIAVGVMLDTMRQVETHLLTRHYDGFLRKGKLHGRTAYGATLAGQGAGPAGSEKIWIWLGGAIAALLALGWVLQKVVWK